MITDYFAFTDESNHSDGDYRSIALLEVHEDLIWEVQSKFLSILNKYNIKKITSFKWKKIQNKNKSNALNELLKYLFLLLEEEQIKIEIIIWNIHDSRHEITGRDDSKNLSYMYDKLIKDFVKRNLKDYDHLYIYSDQIDSIDWNELEEIIFNQDIEIKTYIESFDIIVGSKKVHIQESTTKDDPLIQIADIFAGLTKSSFLDYDRYEIWLTPGQQTLFGPPKKISNRDKYRFPIYKLIYEWGKDNKYGISLNSTRGFVSHDLKSPLNFWLYEPQHENDKAPKRDTYKK